MSWVFRAIAASITLGRQYAWLLVHRERQLEQEKRQVQHHGHIPTAEGDIQNGSEKLTGWSDTLNEGLHIVVLEHTDLLMQTNNAHSAVL